uniref:Gonadal somatic cell derived factor n=1 Tax=Takifugu rubripes TaxID=31033 RepID=A0A674PLI9_TAKRU
MSFSFVATMMLISSSAVIAFVLLPSEEELQAPANAPVSHHRCQREPLQSIRKSLLSELNLQSEPQLPAGGLDLVRKHWRRTFNNMARNAEDPAVLVVDDFTASAEGGNSTGLKCCPLASEVFMTDLGWDSWVIHPPSLIILTCALCDPQGNVVQCPSSQSSTLDANLQPNCCQLTSMKMVPIVYVDQFATLTMASVQLPSNCKCGRSDMGPSSME